MGPCGGKFLPPDCLFPGSADESDARRIRDGRASTLCKDGEWREVVTGTTGPESSLNGYFRGWCPGPNGTAYTFYVAGNEIRVFKLSGIDWNKPTVGPQAKGKE
jgi:hypothetical protein